MIYLDNAATTKLHEKALEAMLPYLQDSYGNPSAVYSLGSKGKKALAVSRRTIAESLGCTPGEIYFTSGGTESDNWALWGGALLGGKDGRPGGHIITTQIEHHAVLNTCEKLERQGVRITYLPVDGEGRVDPERVRQAIRPETVLVSVMFANNEVGTIQPIREIGEITRERGILLHTDAVQAFGHVPIAVEDLGIDLLSASGHKLHGPKGVGFLYVRKSVRLPALINGGGQERGMRAGTENVPAIAGLGEAVRITCETMEEATQKQIVLRDYLEKRILEEIPGCVVNGSREHRLPGTLSICIPPVEGESVLIQLDMRGICASSGSACTIGSNAPSHVLTAMGRSELEAKGSLRFSVSPENTLEEMEETVDALKDIIVTLRKLMGWSGRS